MAEIVATLPLARCGLDDLTLVGVLRTMLLQRALDTRGFQLNRQGKIPFAAGSEGHEGIHAGAGLAFARGRDAFFGYYRDMGLCVAIGLAPVDVLRSMFARATDRSGGRQFPSHFSARELGIHSITSIIAAHCSHAVGAAAAFAYRGETGRAVLCSFGDGATSSGEWHEAMNYAGVHALPIVFLCENNGWAISTPLARQTAQPSIAKKAIAYGMPGVAVDGSDPLGVRDALAGALDRARDGGGPTLVEATCYRFLAHTTDDDDRTYRSPEAVAAERHRDPIPRFEATLREAGLVDDASLDAMRAAVRREIDDATDRAESEASPAAHDLARNVYEGDHAPWR